MNQIDFGESIYSFIITKRLIKKDDNSLEFQIGPYILICDKNGTSIDIENSSKRQLIIFGDCVDVRNQQTKGLAREILLHTKSIKEVINYEYYLGGKYVLFYFDGDALYCLADATSSIPVFYCKAVDDFCCSSNAEWVRRYFNLDQDEAFAKIRKSGDISQAMPYDITVYKDLKQLIPNHYLNIVEGKAIRFINASKKQILITPQKAAEQTISQILTILKMYLEKYEIYCPITSGRDSRTVISFLKTISNETFQCYTIQHGGMECESQEIKIPRNICEILNEPYDVVKDKELSSQMIQKINEILGTGLYSKRTLMIANTVKCYCKRNAIINGDLIGQIGKCSLHRDIPESLASAEYFRFKLHNYSYNAKVELQKWLKEIRESCECVNVFDLFSVENRLGRWAAQENQIYNAIGQVYINIFNSRSIIYNWTAVDRKLRKKSLIHIEYIKRLQENLLQVPFEKDDIFSNLAKSNGLTYFFASALKFYIGKIVFMIRKRRLSNE